jgi:hypothetical protein
MHTDFSLAPIYLFKISGPLTLIKFSPHSFATAEARSVFPHPGNPYKSKLRYQCGLWNNEVAMRTYPDLSLNGDCANIGPYFAGHSSVSRRTLRVSWRPWGPSESYTSKHTLRAFRTSNIGPCYV